ncbi:molecular chaperone [Thalassotalea sp. G2M2-11]|uniref:molecular chaperone n=1 Tax=Thalassotalea sp. G2M2-11 TaxID=2787627 RepID=UPI0019D2EA24|nr:molecular chaperone [Thalassotalea sp. G2M2-11]
MIGFDYGTSNCAVGVMEGDQPEILSLGDHGRLVPSNLYAPSREIIVHWLYQRLAEVEKSSFLAARKLPLQQAQRALRELSLDGIEAKLFFGQAALAHYLEEPEEGYYIKSPKSFLGMSGLVPMQINLFEDIVAAMMLNIKSLAEQNLQREISQAVIGRPINFQGLKGEESNRQAIEVLSNAAHRVGFKDVEFQYEPVAAGFEFEATLSKETKVLVVDIGGGTSDCSMLLMGPNYQQNTDRTASLLAHSGVRVGGNDFDIQLALKGIMPSLGMESLLKSGKQMPVSSYNQAVAINNVNDQTEFYSEKNGRYLQQLFNDAQQPELFARLLQVYREKLSYRLVNGAEQAKIGLSEMNEQTIELSDIASDLTVNISRQLMAEANASQLNNIGQLMTEAVTQARCQPDVVFVTGGTAKSPVISEFLRQQLPNTPLVVGDHFGSVTGGLTRWAQRIYQ